MIGRMAEYEHSLISERTRAGVKDAKKRGVKFGRKKTLGPAQITKARKLIEAGERVRTWPRFGTWAGRRSIGHSVPRRFRLARTVHLLWIAISKPPLMPTERSCPRPKL
jgi:DNA invertase Pin-like site-specific DNA recombinase